MNKPWLNAVGAEFEKPYFKHLKKVLSEQYKKHTIYPAPRYVFNALNLTHPDKVKVVIVGQDPYHQPGQANGLAFSVGPNQQIPPSLSNIYRELINDQNHLSPGHGDLTEWAKQGVLLLNSVLTVKRDFPGSHSGLGWEPFTDAVVSYLSEFGNRKVFILWGQKALTKLPLIDKKHKVITSAHPSPMSAAGFFGTRPFSKCNRALKGFGLDPINWKLTPKKEK